MSHVKTLRSERRYSGTVFNLVVDEVEYTSGNRGVREVADHPGGAVVVPLLDDGSVLLVNQFRYPVKKNLFELPAGKLDAGEDPSVCAARELEEETGYTAGTMTKLTAIYTTPGFCNEQLHLYVATDLKKLPTGQRLEEGEMDLTVRAIPIEEVIQMIENQDIVDGKTMCGIFMVERQIRSGKIHSCGRGR
jgi:ADP-ribose pyrophosphatase